MIVDVFIPTLYRSHNIERLIESFYAHSPTYCYLNWMCPMDDEETIKALKHNLEFYITDYGDMRYVKRIQYMYEHSSADWFLTGSDDIIFHKDWFSKAQEYMDDYFVIGFEDQCNQDLPGTNFLIKKDYIKEQSGVMDAPNTVFHQGYFHNFCDTELVGVAKKRGVFVKCDGVIEHDHPMRKGWNDWDAVYQIAREHWNQDASLYESRAWMW